MRSCAAQVVTFLVAFILTYAILNAIFPKGDETTVLVGTGCEGHSTIAVAYEEDRLPRCAVIERHVVQQ